MINNDSLRLCVRPIHTFNQQGLQGYWLNLDVFVIKKFAMPLKKREEKLVWKHKLAVAAKLWVKSQLDINRVKNF
jgi:hypothetical protein